MGRNDKLKFIVAMVVFGTIGVFRKYILVPSSVIALARGLIGTIFLAVFMRIRHKKIDWELIKKHSGWLLLSGAVLGFNWIFLFEAYQYTSVAAATLCYYMAPVIIVIISVTVLKEKLTVVKAVCSCLAVAGMVLVSGIIETGFSSISEIKGILFGLAAACLYATVILINRRIAEIPAYDKTILQLGICAAVLLPYTFITVDYGALTFDSRCIIMLLLVGIIHTGICYVLYFGSVGTMKVQAVALLSYIDPVEAVILSALVLNEGITIYGIIGAVMVLGSAIISETCGQKESCECSGEKLETL